MIRIFETQIDKNEEREVIKTLRSGHIASGKRTTAFEKAFARYTGTKFAVSLSSGTAALHASLSSLGVSKGDEVLTTAFSFIATANSALYCGARPVFCDINPQTFNLDSDKVEGALKKNKKIKAIIAVHLYGLPCEIDRIKKIASRHKVYLIEDCAQAAGAEYNGKKVGSFGHISAFSFYATKNITTAEGGMITTNNALLEKRMRSIINHGRRNRFLHADLGFNLRTSDVNAAIGIQQLKKLDKLNLKRIRNAEFLSSHIDHPMIIKPLRAGNAKHVYHLYTVKVKDNRKSLVKHLARRGIESAIIYPLPIYAQPLYKKMGYSGAGLPNTEKAARRVLSLPVHPGLSLKDLKKISEAVNKWKPY
jgi:dTDP-4-amino-4,6-dideoxygalactose transaminase